MPAAKRISVARVYEPRSATVGLRVLVDRVWPRGLSKETADLDEWCRDVAPSNDLRRWYGHVPERFEEFARRYEQELASGDPASALAHLRSLARSGPLTLLTATRDIDRSQAAVLSRLVRSGRTI